MFRSFSSDARFSDGQSSAPSSPLGVASVGLDSQESSWLGLLSRPAVSLLRKVRLWSAAPAEAGLGFLGEEREILRQLHELMPPAAQLLTSPRCQQDGPGVLKPGPCGAVPWLPAVSGTQSPGEMELQPPQTGYVSSCRALINQVLLSSQEVPAAEGKGWVSAGPPVRSGPGGQAGPWWGGFIPGEDGAERLCVGPPGRTKPPPVFGSVLRENAGPPQRARGGEPHSVQNTEGLLGGQRGPREAARPPPEQDNGYSSLEEELSQRALLSQLRGPGQEQDQQEPRGPQTDGPEEGPEPEEVLPAPWCRNQDIAFIMGCPCSEEEEEEEDEEEDDDDDSSSSQSDPQSEDEDEDEDEDDDDDGFNSEGSSDEDEDEEAERLWTSLCQSLDPYNLRNFRAPLHTGRTAPAPPPASPPSDSWDDSASEADEEESLRLLSSLSCSSDPYSPFNFTAPLRTSGPAGSPGVRTRTEPTPQNLRRKPAAPPEYSREEAEERLDSGFSEARRCKPPKKVRFCDDVEEFFASGGEEEEEDRRGPWEELARDRCRFLRRCQEVEQSIGFCLQPQHRRQVFQRLAALSHT